MKYAIQIRADHAEKQGGDTALAKAFARRLQHAGHEITWVSDAKTLISLKPEILLAFNLDQPLELLSLCRVARSICCRIGVYALHHPRAGVKAYLSTQRKGLRGLVARIVRGDPASYFHIMSLLRELSRRNPLVLTYAFKSPDKSVEDISAYIDYLLVSGSSEDTEVKRNWPCLARIPVWLIPHPVEMDSSSAVMTSGANRSRIPGHRRFLIAGRIESRKNQVAVLKIALRFPNDEFTFAGSNNETEPGYTSEFHRRLGTQPNCHWVGQLNMPDLLNLIFSVDAVLSPSWFEVMSLINLFAYALKTPVISSSYTYDSDLLGTDVIRFRPDSPDELACAVRNFDISSDGEKRASELQQRAATFAAKTWMGFDEWVARVATDFARTK